MRSVRYSTGILMILLAALGCTKGNESSGGNNSGGGGSNSCSGVPASFAANVLPLIQTRCATNSGCHAAGAANSGGPLTNYSQIFNRRSNIRAAVQNGSMPPGGTLTTAEKNAIICWIDNGAANN